MKLYNLLLFLHILHYLNIALQIIIDLQMLVLQTTQIELTELQYTIQKKRSLFSNSYRTVHYKKRSTI